jgi:acylphosphatase
LLLQLADGTTRSELVNDEKRRRLEMRAVKYRVSGRVQGVGFRFFVLQAAEALGLRGWVRNMADGSVEAVAEGTADQHRVFEEQLRQGPRWSRVTGVQSHEMRQTELEGAFQIRPDGI